MSWSHLLCQSKILWLRTTITLWCWSMIYLPVRLCSQIVQKEKSYCLCASSTFLYFLPFFTYCISYSYYVTCFLSSHSLFSWQGSYEQDFLNTSRPHKISTIRNARGGYSQTPTLNCLGRALTSRSHYASKFPIIRLPKAPYIKNQRMACANSMANVTTYSIPLLWYSSMIVFKKPLKQWTAKFHCQISHLKEFLFYPCWV
jgi:hypothetical protein